MKPENLEEAKVLVKNLHEAEEKVDIIKATNEIRVGNVNHKGVSASFMLNDLECKDILMKELLQKAHDNVTFFKTEIGKL